VVVVPALAGLGAPHWRSNATGSITGLRLGTSRAHVVRAALEAMAHQCHDLAAAFAGDGAAWDALCIDGGMSANDWMAQDLADILGVPVERPADVETTALGAAMLAAVGTGIYADPEAAQTMRPDADHFVPTMDAAVRRARLNGWQRARDAVIANADR
jgi:glycerol kinase